MTCGDVGGWCMAWRPESRACVYVSAWAVCEPVRGVQRVIWDDFVAARRRRGWECT